MDPGSKLKKVATNLLVMIVAVVLVFGAAEFAVRLLFKDDVVLFPRYHTSAQYGQFALRRIRPNSVFWHTSVDGRWRFETNSQGFRNATHIGYRKEAGTVRIMSLGDSHTQGYEVSQGNTFSAVIERYLQKAGYRAEVINAGVSGFSTAEALLFLENEGVRYQPDVVVLGFYANDYGDNVKAGLFGMAANGELEVRKKAHLPGVRVQNVIYSVPGVKWLSENSYFYSMLFNTTWTFFKTRLARASKTNSVEYAVATEEEVEPYERLLTLALIKRMHEFCRRSGIAFILVDIPRRTPSGSIATSFDSTMYKGIDDFSDYHVLSDHLLGDYSGVVEIHRPHGHHHIADFAHAMIGVSAGRHILHQLSVDSSVHPRPLNEVRTTPASGR